MDEEPEAPPEAPAERRPIIVIKRKSAGHGGHHGGAWKVAYADFVTAMMALFIVLWLMGSDKEVKEAIAQYFRNPTGPGKLTGSSAPGVGAAALEIGNDDMTKLKDKIQQVLKSLPNFKSLQDNIELTITPDGLRIELLETAQGMFFESGKGVPTESGSELLSKLAEELGKLPNNLLIEGHTDAKPFGSGNAYSNWELSSDRANSARKPDGNQRPARRPGRPGARLRRPPVAASRGPGKSLQPARIVDRAVSGTTWARRRR